MRRTLSCVLCLLLAAAPLCAQGDADKQATVAYLQKLQTDEGGFRADARASAADLPSTTAAVRALRYFGGQPRDRAACTAFVAKCFDRDAGGFAARPGGKAEYRPTAVGIMAVVDLKMPVELYRDPVIKYLDEHSRSFEEIRLTAASFESLGRRPPHAEKWLQEIAKMKKDDGTYGKGAGAARDTGGAVCAVLRLGGRADHRDAVLKVLNAGRRRDGGYGKADADGSDLETTYRVMRAFHMLKARPEGADRLRAFIARCRNDDGGYGVAPGRPSTVGGCYYSGIILHWLDQR